MSLSAADVDVVVVGGVASVSTQPWRLIDAKVRKNQPQSISGAVLREGLQNVLMRSDKTVNINLKDDKSESSK